MAAITLPVTPIRRLEPMPATSGRAASRRRARGRNPRNTPNDDTRKIGKLISGPAPIRLTIEATREPTAKGSRYSELARTISPIPNPTATAR